MSVALLLTLVTPVGVLGAAPELIAQAATSPHFMMQGGGDFDAPLTLSFAPVSSSSSSQAQSSASSASSKTPQPGGSRGTTSNPPVHPAAPSSSSASSTSSHVPTKPVVHIPKPAPVHAPTLHPAAPVNNEHAQPLIAQIHTEQQPIFGMLDLERMLIVLILINLLLTAIILLLLLRMRRAKPQTGKPRKRSKKKRRAVIPVLIAGLAILSVLTAVAPHVFAESTVPNRRLYSSRLLNNAGQPVTTAVNIRFSYWNSADLQTGDIDGAGNINTAAPHYAGWTEVQNITPDVNGSFNAELGSITPLPDITLMTLDDLRNLHVQIEVKNAGAPNTSYELMDPDASDPTNDRSAVFTSTFARNADYLDRHDAGTGSGSIPFLLSGGVLPVGTVPNGTDQNFFTIDADNSSTTNVTLLFGQSLGKTLKYSITNSQFELNDSLAIQGNLIVSGLINGVDLTTLQSPSSEFKVTKNTGLFVKVNSGSYRLGGVTTSFAGSSSLLMTNNATNYIFFGSGGLTARTASFPTDESAIRIATVTTAGGNVSTIVDARVTLSDDRELTRDIVMHPEFANAALQGDATSNVGQLSVTHDAIAVENYYSWTSTKSGLQDYDILVKVPVPEHFTTWASNPLKVSYRSTSASNTDNKLDIAVFDTNGQPVTITGTSTDLASTSWATTTLNFGGSPIWTPGASFLLRFRLSARNNAQMHLGDVILSPKELSGP